MFSTYPFRSDQAFAQGRFSRSSKCGCFCLIAFLLLVLPMTVMAEPSAEISGVVRDNNQVPVAGVRITITSHGTRSESIVYTDKDGAYRAVGLEPDYYIAQALHIGFQPAVRRDLRLLAGGSLHLDLELQAVQAAWSMPASGTLAYMFLTALVPALVLILFTEPGRKAVQGAGKLSRWLLDKFLRTACVPFPEHDRPPWIPETRSEIRPVEN
jgi:hypothetical protein